MTLKRMSMRTMFNFVAALAVLPVISSCKEPVTPNLNTATGLIVKDGDAVVGNIITLDLNGEKTLTAVLEPPGAGGTLTWTSSGPAVTVTPSGDGLSAAIKGIIDGASAAITVSPTDSLDPVAKIFIVKVDSSAFYPINNLTIASLGTEVGETLSLAANELQSLTANMSPPGIKGTVTWECSDTAVTLTPAKDNLSARILGIAAGGSAVITVSAANMGNTNQMTKTFTVTVGAALSGPFYVSSLTGSDTNPGTVGLPFKTISKAAGVAQAGDTINVLEGIYRERVSPPRGGTAGAYIKYLAEPGKRVFIKGSDVYDKPWGTGAGKPYAGERPPNPPVRPTPPPPKPTPPPVPQNPAPPKK